MADAPPGNRTTAADARRWLAAMPARVGGQRRLLESLIAAAEAAPAFRWLELGGSRRGQGRSASSGSSPSAAAAEGVETRQNSRVPHRSLSEFATRARELYQATAKIKALRLSQRQ